jgi:hypothetical protein
VLLCELVFHRFSPGLCKTSKVTTAHVVARSLHKPVNCFNVDVIDTYKRIVSHWPVF